jgi:hypothetical protein
VGRFDRSVSLTDQSGDFINSGNPLPTSGSGGGGSGGTSMADKSTFAEGTTQFTPVGGVRLDTPASDVADGKTAAVRITPKRAMWATLRNEAGTEIATSSDPLRIDPTGTTAQPVNDNGGSLSVDDGGGSLTVDGTVAATQSGSWTVTANAGTGTFSVKSEVQLDYDTSGGTQSLSVVGIALPASGGAVAGGTSTNPIRTDPTGTTAQPVSDNGGSLTVDDGGGSITVDGTVAATQSGTWSVQLTDGSLTASIRNTGSNDSLNVAIVDASGNHITSFGGGTQYTEADVDATPMGTVSMWWDSGDNSIHAASPTKPFPVTVVSGGGGGMVDDSPFSPGVSTVVPMGALFDDVATDTVDEGDIGAPRMSGSRVLYVTTFAGSPVAVTDNGGSLTVDGTVSISGSVTVTGTVAATQSGSWTVTANAGSGTFTVDQVDSASLDYDSGAGTVNQTVIGIALPGAGGPVAGGTSTNPVRTDPTGTTAQPVTDNGGSLTVDDGGGSITVDGTVAVSSVSGNVTVVQGTATNLKVDASGVAVPVTDNGGSLTVDGSVSISGTVTVAGTVAVSSVAGNVTVVQSTATNLKVDASGVPVPVTDNGGSLTVDGTVAVSGSVAVTQSTSPWVVGDGGGSLTVDGPLTNTELRATPVPVSGTVDVSSVAGNVTVVQSTATNLKVDASGVAVPVTDGGGSLTIDGTVAVSGTVTVSDGGGSLTVDGTVAVAGTTASGVSLASTNPVYVGMNSGSGLGRHLTAIVSNRDTDGTAILGVAPVGWDAVNSLYRDLEVDTANNLKVTVNTAIVGGLTHNAAVPAATNVGVLPAIANATAPTYNEGDQVLLSVDLDGTLRSTAGSSTGGDITNRNGMDCQAVYDPVVRETCEQILLTLYRLEERMFSEN